MKLHRIIADRDHESTPIHTEKNDPLDPTNCDDNLTICFNGGSCAPLKTRDNTTGRSYYCNCSTTEGLSSYAGNGCEFKATQYCALPSAKPIPNEAKITFCTNNGTCNEVHGPDSDGILRHTGCKCPAGFVGDYCEYINGTIIIKEYTNSTHSNQNEINRGNTSHSHHHGLRIFFGVFTFFLAVILIFIHARGYVLKNRNKRHQLVAATEELEMDEDIRIT